MMQFWGAMDGVRGAFWTIVGLLGAGDAVFVVMIALGRVRFRQLACLRHDCPSRIGQGEPFFKGVDFT